jgi:competence protein ComEA
VADPHSDYVLAPETFRERLERLLEFRRRDVVALAVLATVVLGGAAFAFARSLPHAASAGHAVAAGLTDASVSAETSASPGVRLVVHVAGAVVRPGVYEFPAGARVGDAVRAAGGAIATADVDAINLARPLSDGERVYVPRKGEAPPATDGSGGGGGGGTGAKININTASVAELDTLPGIGPALAQRIVDYRTQHGPFRTIRDLLRVEGIGEKKFNGLKDLVTV